VALSRGPRVNWSRTAIDPLFASTAKSHGPSVIGVVLTGRLNDGTAGLCEIKRHGGTTIVQDPSEAICPGMPASALKHVAIDHGIPLADNAAHPVPDLQGYRRTLEGLGPRDGNWTAIPRLKVMFSINRYH